MKAEIDKFLEKLKENEKLENEKLQNEDVKKELENLNRRVFVLENKLLDLAVEFIKYKVDHPIK